MKWSKEDAEFLKDNYGKVALKIIAKKLNRTPTSVSSKAKQLEIRVKRPSQKRIINKKRWSDKDTKLLIRNYQHKTIKQIADILNRNEKSVMKKAYDLGLKKHPREEWTNQDLAILYGTQHKSAKEIAKQTGRSIESIRAKRRQIREELK